MSKGNEPFEGNSSESLGLAVCQRKPWAKLFIQCYLWTKKLIKTIIKDYIEWAKNVEL